LPGFFHRFFGGTAAQPSASSGTTTLTNEGNWSRIFGMPATASGISVTAAEAMTVPGVAACVQVISEDLAKVPLSLYRRDGGSKEVATDHPLHRMVHDRPSPWLDSFKMRRVMVQEALLEARSRAGLVRECHGDLHLGNIAMIDGRPVVFDAIEFSPALRWIDPINDAAFLTMDLRQRQRPALAQCFINRYLQVTGDYEGLALLQGFEVYRALVRAKIAAIRSGQPDLDETDRQQVEHELKAYLAVAAELAAPRRGALVILHGVSGSGKSHVAETLVEQWPAVVLRSDLERKRLLGLDATADATAHGGYAPDVTRRTYGRLAEAATVAANGGYVAVVDATFLRRGDRQEFADLAQQLGVPYAIVACEAPVAVLEARIAQRASRSGNVSDADGSVLHEQLASLDPLDTRERVRAVRVAPDRPLDTARLQGLLASA